MEGGTRGSSERTVKSSELSITQTFEFPAARPTIRSRLSINRSACAPLLVLEKPLSCATYISASVSENVLFDGILFGLNVEL